MSLTRVTNRVLEANSVGVAQLSAGAVPNKLGSEIGAFAFRNKIINGGMEIDQRNAGTVCTITAAAPQVYSLDRWYGFATGASTTHQRVAITNIPRLSYALRITGATGNTITWAAQRIESSTSSSLAGLSATLSFYAASNTLTQLQVSWGRPGSSTPDDWSLTPNPPVSTGSQNFSITSTLTRYQVTFIVPQEARRGFYVQFHNAQLLTGQTIDITGVQLEEGPTATPFEQRPIGTELALCQRYYETTYPSGRTPGSIFNPSFPQAYDGVYTMRFGAYGNSAGLLWFIRYAVPKRVIPAVMPYSTYTGNAGACSVFSAALTYSAQYLVNTGSGSPGTGTFSTQYHLFANIPSPGIPDGYYAQAHFVADAEL